MSKGKKVAWIQEKTQAWKETDKKTPQYPGRPKRANSMVFLKSTDVSSTIPG